MHTHLHTCAQRTHILLHTNPLLRLFHMFLPVLYTVVIFGIVPVAATPQNVSGGVFPISSSASSCPQTLTIQARSFFHLLSRRADFSGTHLLSVFHGFY